MRLADVPIPLQALVIVVVAALAALAALTVRGAPLVSRRIDLGVLFAVFLGLGSYGIAEFHETPTYRTLICTATGKQYVHVERHGKRSDRDDYYLFCAEGDTRSISKEQYEWVVPRHVYRFVIEERKLSYSRVVGFVDITDPADPHLAPGVQGQGTG